MATKQNSQKKPSESKYKSVMTYLRKPLRAIQTKSKAFLARRPHRSFRLTRRRDYRRSLVLPNYTAFTIEVEKLLWKNRKTFIGMIVVLSLLSAVLVGLASQETYGTLTDSLRETGSKAFDGDITALGQAGLLFLAATTGSISNTLTDVQQIYAIFIGLLVWLTTVWITRNIVAGHKVKLRDGLYSAGAPIISTLIVFLVGVVQLLPIAIAFIGYNAAAASGILNGGVESMLFWFAAGLLALLSLYWVTSTFIALVVVTLPGMYPFRALRIAGDLVVGRRVRILLRILWMLLILVIIWVLVMIPIILLDTWIKGLLTQVSSVPVIPATILLLSTFSIVWCSSYVYLLYRKVVDDDALPA